MVPDELSITGAPSASTPVRLASSMTCLATRSFIANRFASSSLAYTSTSSGAATASLTSGVCPMASMTESKRTGAFHIECQRVELQCGGRKICARRSDLGHAGVVAGLVVGEHDADHGSA